MRNDAENESSDCVLDDPTRGKVAVADEGKGRAEDEWKKIQLSVERDFLWRNKNCVEKRGETTVRENARGKQTCPTGRGNRRRSLRLRSQIASKEKRQRSASKGTGETVWTEKEREGN